ncbi:MAG: hypothetical protein ACLSB9_36165 [Hydrogeniiclostridium mannosilyticum]
MPLLWPTVSVHKITDITAEQLMPGIKALILNADDTLSGHKEQVLFPALKHSYVHEHRVSYADCFQ